MNRRLRTRLPTTKVWSMSLTLRSLKSTYSTPHAEQQIDQYSTLFELLKSTSAHIHMHAQSMNAWRVQHQLAVQHLHVTYARAWALRSVGRPACTCSMPTVPLDPLHACTAGFVGGGGCGLRVGCLPRQGQQVRPACLPLPAPRSGRGRARLPSTIPAAPGKPACRASIFINPLGLAVKLRPRRRRRPAGVSTTKWREHATIDLGCRNTRSDGQESAWDQRELVARCC